MHRGVREPFCELSRLSAADYAPRGLVIGCDPKACSWAVQPSRRTCKKCAKGLSSRRLWDVSHL